MDHSYEEIRNVMLDIIAGRESISFPPSQFGHLKTGVAEILEVRDGKSDKKRGDYAQQSESDSELVREIFWDLFRQGIITLGCDRMNAQYPFFKLTQSGRRILENENTYFFHDLTTYTTLIQSNVPNINDVTLLYLQEAMQAFKAGCMLSATVMLGVAAEHSFMLLLETAENNPKYGSRFSSAAKERNLLSGFRKFNTALEQHVVLDLPPDVKEGLDVELAGVLSVIRTFRNDSGHPSGKIMGREQTYVLLQMFIPYCKRVYRLIDFFAP